MEEAIIKWAKTKEGQKGYWLLGVNGDGSYIREVEYYENHNGFTKEVNPSNKTPILYLSECRVTIK